MTINEYQTESYKNIQPHYDKKDEILNWSIGLSEEVGETLNHVKHQYWGKESINHVAISKELGDILWYLSALCTSLNISLDTVAQLNIAKLNHRYQNKFSNEKSKMRHSLDEGFTETSEYINLIEKLKFKK